MIVDDLYNNILMGKSGMNIGLSTGLPKFDSITYGIQRKWMYIWAGDSGRGNIIYKLIYY